MLHRPLLEKYAPVDLPGLTCFVMLLHEDHTASPVIADSFVSSLDPATNEVDHADYERQPVTLTKTWDTDHAKIDGGSVNFGPLTSEHTGQAGALAALCVSIGDGSDDSANELLKTFPVTLVFDGGDVIVDWDTTGVASLGWTD